MTQIPPRPWRKAGRRNWPAGAACLSVLLVPHSLWACAACYGQSDAPMAAGMNWGIMSLLGIIIFVLGGVAGFFVFLARRSVKLAASAPDELAVPHTATDPETAEADLNQPAAHPLATRGSLGGVSALARRRPQCAGASRTRN